jgi:hypothetical protein
MLRASERADNCSRGQKLARSRVRRSRECMCKWMARLAGRRQHRLRNSESKRQRSLPPPLYRGPSAGLGMGAEERGPEDGAEWIWNLAQEPFPAAIEIVDLYHARQHLWDLGSKLYPCEDAAKTTLGHESSALVGCRQDRATGGSPARPGHRHSGTGGDDIEAAGNNLERNAARMRYPTFRQQRWFAGSKVIEAGCNAGCTVMQSCAAQQPPITILSWMIC